MQKVFIGSDHAGFEYKEAIKEALVADGFEVIDKGNAKYEELDDYPDYIYPVAKAVSEDLENSVGIVLGGSGQGEAFCANKVKGIRAVIGFSEFVVKASREHNDANVLSFGQRTITKAQAVEWSKLWLKTHFPGDERHVRRIEKVKELEEKLFK